MPWDYRFDDRALKELSKLDRHAQREIIRYLDERIAGAADPRLFGKALGGDLRGLWRFRVGDYRLVCQLQNQTAVVLVLAVGHRKNIYG